MGAWGYNLYDNDTSCDVRDLFVRYLKENQKMYAWDVMEKKLLPYYENQMDDVNVVLALADLSITFSGLSEELTNTALHLIDEEMKNINNWNEPDKRKAFLIDYESYLKTTRNNK